MTHSPAPRAVAHTGAATGAGEVLITGAAGFIGGHVARACHDAGWTVTGLDVRALPPPLHGFARQVQGQADDPAVLRDVRAGRYHAVVHQAAITSTLASDWSLLRDINIRQPLELASACAVSGTIFIYASSHSVYGTMHQRRAAVEGCETAPSICTGPLNLYARSKLELDAAMAARQACGQPPWTGLRYTNVFGPGESHKGPMASIISQLLRKSADGENIHLFSDTLQACRDYIPVHVVADVIVKILHRPVPSGIYNLGSGQPVAFATLLEWCAEFSGSGPAVLLVPNPVADRYQYWTCADLAKIKSSLPELRLPAAEDIHRAAEILFRQFQADSEERAGRPGTQHRAAASRPPVPSRQRKLSDMNEVD
ncbi:MAG TPA: NAD-dependent epimerase/dehydratase family protein [Streptosporangiaceae bacterium]|nr:NAD-dependent epimerase/dehydratase family protein [Streptosporangiaceae bacterium]